MKQTFRGYTLVEILVVVGMVSCAVVLGLAVSVPRLQSARLDSLMGDMASLIVVTQQNGYIGKHGTNHGVYFQSGSYSIFTGDSYASASSVDVVHYPTGTSMIAIMLDDNSNEVVFSRGTVRPTTYGSVRLSNGEDTLILEINEQGLVDWYAP